MKQYSILLLGLLWVRSACPGTPVGKQTKLPGDFSLTMSRDACFGSCPVYKLSIDSTGTVSYDGLYYVKVLGHRTWQLNNEQSSQLLHAINASGFFGIPDDYQQGGKGCSSFATDLPSVKLGIALSDRHHEIMHQHGCSSCAQLNSFLRAVKRTTINCAMHKTDDRNIDKLFTLETKIGEIVGVSAYIGDDASRTNSPVNIRSSVPTISPR